MYLSSYATLNSDCNSAKIESLGEYCTKSELTCASSQNDSVIWPSNTISSETFFAKIFLFSDLEYVVRNKKENINNMGSLKFIITNYVIRCYLLKKLSII